MNRHVLILFAFLLSPLAAQDEPQDGEARHATLYAPQLAVCKECEIDVVTTLAIVSRRLADEGQFIRIDCFDDEGNPMGTTTTSAAGRGTTTSGFGISFTLIPKGSLTLEFSPHPDAASGLHTGWIQVQAWEFYSAEREAWEPGIQMSVGYQYRPGDLGVLTGVAVTASQGQLDWLFSLVELPPEADDPEQRTVRTAFAILNPHDVPVEINAETAFGEVQTFTIQPRHKVSQFMSELFGWNDRGVVSSVEVRASLPVPLTALQAAESLSLPFELWGLNVTAGRR